MELRTKLIIVLVLYVVGIYKLIRLRIFLSEHKEEFLKEVDGFSITLSLLPFDFFEVIENQRKYKLIHLGFVAFSWILGIVTLFLWVKQLVKTAVKCSISTIIATLRLIWEIIIVFKICLWAIWKHLIIFFKYASQILLVILKSLINI